MLLVCIRTIVTGASGQLQVQIRSAIGFGRTAERAADRVALRVREWGVAHLPCAFLAVPVPTNTITGGRGNSPEGMAPVGLEAAWELVPAGTGADGPSAVLDERSPASNMKLSPARSLLRLANVSHDDTRGTQHL